MSLDSRIVSRFKAEFLGEIVSMVSSAVLIILLARLLDPTGYGLLFLAISVFGTIEILSKLGIAKSAARYIAEFKETDPKMISHILKISIIYNMITIIIVVVLLLFSYRHISNLLGEPHLTQFLVFGTLFVTFHTLYIYVRSVLQGFEQIRIASLMNALDKVLRLIFSVGLVLLGYGALGALFGYILSSAVISITGLTLIYSRYYERTRATSLSSELAKRIGAYAFPLTATNTANVLDKRVDTILVGFFLNPIAVSYYVIGKQFVSFVSTPVSALGFTISPTYGSQKAKGNLNQASELFETALVYTLLLYLPASAGLILVAEPTILLVFGSEYLGAVPVLQVLALYAILYSLSSIISNGLDYLGRARERAIVKTITSVLNVILNVLFIPLFGVIGAAIATVASYSLYTFANLYFINQEFEIETMKLIRDVYKIIFITAIMSVVVYYISSYIVGWGTLFIVMVVGLLIWAFLSIVTGLIEFHKVVSMIT